MKHLFRMKELLSMGKVIGHTPTICEIIAPPKSGRTNFLVYEVAERAIENGFYPIYVDVNRLSVSYLESVISDVINHIDNPSKYIEKLRNELEVRDYFVTADTRIEKGNYNITQTISNLLFDLIVKLNGAVTYLFDNANSYDYQIKKLFAFSVSTSKRVQAYTTSPKILPVLSELNSKQFFLTPIEQDKGIIEHVAGSFSYNLKDCTEVFTQFNSMYWVKKFFYLHKITENKEEALAYVEAIKTLTFQEVFQQQLNKFDLVLLQIISKDKHLYSDGSRELMSNEINEKVTNSRIQNSLLKLHTIGITTSKSVKNLQIKDKEIIECLL